MAAKLKLEKFKGDGAGFIMIRYEFLPSGKIVAFCIAGTDISTLGFGNDVDFDKESDELIAKHHDSQNHLAFEYVPNIGFDAVDIKKQEWFIFR